METIRNYIDNMFAALPDSARKQKLYGELLANMEERYHELKAQGRSEHEAIGVVISEFGDIGELFAPEEEAQRPLPAATQEAVDRYFAATARYGNLMAWGVALLVFSPAVVILLRQVSPALRGNKMEFAALGMFLLAAAGVALLIYGGMSLKLFHTLETATRIPPRLRESLQQAYEQEHPRSVFSVIAGVCLLVLCPVPPMVMTIAPSLVELSAVLLFLMAALGVQILVRNGKTQSAYRKLLRLGKYAAK